MINNTSTLSQLTLSQKNWHLCPHCIIFVKTRRDIWAWNSRLHTSYCILLGPQISLQYILCGTHMMEPNLQLKSRALWASAPRHTIQPLFTVHFQHWNVELFRRFYLDLYNETVLWAALAMAPKSHTSHKQGHFNHDLLTLGIELATGFDHRFTNYYTILIILHYYGDQKAYYSHVKKNYPSSYIPLIIFSNYFCVNCFTIIFIQKLYMCFIKNEKRKEKLCSHFVRVINH